MGSPLPPINYTARDFNAVYESFRRHLQERFPDTWRDFYESGIGMALVDLVSAAFDILSFQVDYTANELYLDTARDRRSVLLLGKLVGYQLGTATSASVVCSASLAAIQAEDVIIPVGTQITSRGNVPFYTVTEQRILAGQLIGTVTFVQGRTRTITFTADGTNYQRYTLPETPVVQDTVTIDIDGDEWSETESLVYVDGASRSFSVEYDEDSVAYLTFGNNVNGLAPPLGATITVTYRTGGGVSGNIALTQIAGSINGYREGVAPISWVPVGVVNNVYRGSGGENAETLTHAKLWIPKWIKSCNRAVTEDDYDVLGNIFSDPTYGAPAFTKAKLKQEIPELNTVLVSVWGRDSEGGIAPASTGLKQAIEDYFNNDGPGAVRMLCQHCKVVDGQIMYVDIKLRVAIQTNMARAEVTAAVQRAIQEMFDSSLIQPGVPFRISALYDTVQSVAGIKYSIVEEMTLSTGMEDYLGAGPTAAFNHTFELEPGQYIVPSSTRFWHGAELGMLYDNGDGDIVDGENNVVGGIDYRTGVCNFTFNPAPAVGDSVWAYCRYVVDTQRGGLESTGDGTTQRFTAVLEYPPVNPRYETLGMKGIAFTDGVQVVVDDGLGNLVGDVDSYLAPNRIDYTSGAYDFAFAQAPFSGVGIYSTYRQILKTASQDLPVEKTQLATLGNIQITVI